jgi:hypothetical protein
MKKKAVFFTFAAIFLIIILIAIITTTNTYRYREKSTAISSRVKTMNNFLYDFDKDMNREIYIGGYRALISINSYLRQIQGFIPNFKEVFSEILLNGTANGTTMDIMQQEGQGADILSWTSRINEESSKLNVKVELEVNDVNIIQTSPWNVTIVFNATVNISDLKGIASWTFDKLYFVQFPIEGFEDPLYVVATSDKLTNVINVTPYSDYVDDLTKNPANLLDHVKESYYIASTDAPSFIMRFSGNFSASDYGIESMVDSDDYFSQYGYYLPRSAVDYIYFGNQTGIPTSCNVSGMPGWFRIDNAHMTDYEIDKLTWDSCT